MTYRSHSGPYPAKNGHPSHDDGPSLHRCYPGSRNIFSRVKHWHLVRAAGDRLSRSLFYTSLASPKGTCPGQGCAEACPTHRIRFNIAHGLQADLLSCFAIYDSMSRMLLRDDELDECMANDPCGAYSSGRTSSKCNLRMA
jgi:hypothetical protein